MKMKKSTKDQAAGKLHVVKGKLKEKAGQVSGNPELENEGTAEWVGGKVRDVIGKIEKAVDR
jgi:uncharacterized protein YjbJ (UPF0337 family)